MFTNETLGIKIVSRPKYKKGISFWPCHNTVVDKLKPEVERPCGNTPVMCLGCHEASYCQRCRTCGNGCTKKAGELYPNLRNDEIPTTEMRVKAITTKPSRATLDDFKALKATLAPKPKRRKK